MTASPGIAIAFILLVLAMTAIAITAIARSPLPASDRSRAILVFVGLYLAVPGALAAAGALDAYTPVPRPLILIVLITIISIRAAHSRLGAALASSSSFAFLVGVQAFRIPVELILCELAIQGAIPVVMTYSGRNFDIVTGITAAILGIVLLLKRDLPRRLIAGWNVMGLILLIIIVVIAALSTPVPFQRFGDPDNRLPGVFPYVWLPTLLVQLALIGHLLVFLKLKGSAQADRQAAS